MSTGRPTRYSEKVAETILVGLSDGRTLREVCRSDESLPSERTIRTWALEGKEGFGVRYDRAREIGYHAMADEIIDIIDDGRNDWVKRRKGGDDEGGDETVVDHEHISRSKLRFEGRRWLLSKALPKIYGDKLALAGDGDNPLTVVIRKFTDA